jgi:hypothetical protein
VIITEASNTCNIACVVAKLEIKEQGFFNASASGTNEDLAAALEY